MQDINTKVLIPNKEWIIQLGNQKVGTISKSKKGYIFFKNGRYVSLKDLEEISQRFGITSLESSIKRVQNKFQDLKSYSIYDYPCSSKPYRPIYNVQQKLPLFAKSDKSKSQFCAGYYVIKFHKGWIKSFCPKLITLERYPYFGPFKTEQEMKTKLNSLS